MQLYHVECRGECREVYLIEAASAEEAMTNWADGTHCVTEAYNIFPVSAHVEDED